MLYTEVMIPISHCRCCLIKTVLVNYFFFFFFNKVVGKLKTECKKSSKLFRIFCKTSVYCIADTDLEPLRELNFQEAFHRLYLFPAGLQTVESQSHRHLRTSV